MSYSISQNAIHYNKQLSENLDLDYSLSICTLVTKIYYQY